MPSPFYNFSSPVIPGSTIRSDKYNTDQLSIDTAFELVEQSFAGVEENFDSTLFLSGERTRAQNLVPIPTEESLLVIELDKVSLFPIQELRNIAEQIDNIPAQLEQMSEYAQSAEEDADRAEEVLQEVETGWFFVDETHPDVTNRTIDAIKNRKMQIDAIGGEFNVNLVPMVADDTLVIHVSTVSDSLVRLVNGLFSISGKGGSIANDKNLTLKAGDTLSLVCRESDKLEIL